MNCHGKRFEEPEAASEQIEQRKQTVVMSTEKPPTPPPDGREVTQKGYRVVLLLNPQGDRPVAPTKIRNSRIDFDG